MTRVNTSASVLRIARDPNAEGRSEKTRVPRGGSQITGEFHEINA
jgi:hypothetical protein